MQIHFQPTSRGDLLVFVGDLMVGTVSWNQGWRIMSLQRKDRSGSAQITGLVDWFEDLVDENGATLALADSPLQAGAHNVLVGDLQVASILPCANCPGVRVQSAQDGVHPLAFQSLEAAVAYLTERLSKAPSADYMDASYTARYATDSTARQHYPHVDFKYEAQDPVAIANGDVRVVARNVA